MLLKNKQKKASNKQAIRLNTPRLSNNAQLLPQNIKAAFEEIILRQLARHINTDDVPPAEEQKSHNSILELIETYTKVREKENEQAHRHEMDLRLLDAEIWRGRLPQIFGLVIALSVISATILSILMGSPWSGALISTGGIAGLVTAYLKGLQSIDTARRTSKMRPKPVVRHRT